MTGAATAPRTDRFFLVGPLRTGTSLLSRCLDDHPEAICLCESEVNRALFRDYIVAHHVRRMVSHGLTREEAVGLLDQRAQDHIPSWESWFDAVRQRLAELYDKPDAAILGDKSPDFYRSPDLVRHLATTYPLVYTSRDPRAIYASILVQDAPEADKVWRWRAFAENVRAWGPYLDRPNVLTIRYEDLILTPQATMQRVHDHLGLADSSRFLEPFARKFPGRFLWKTAIDWSTGVRHDFDPRRIGSWRSTLTPEQIRSVESDPVAAGFLARFGYDERPALSA